MGLTKNVRGERELFLYSTLPSEYKKTHNFEKANYFFFLTSKWLRANFLNDYKVEVDYWNEEITSDKILSSIKSLPTDENDVIIIYVSTHGSEGKQFILGRDNYITQKELNEAIHSVKYGRLIYWANGSCDLRDFMLGPYPGEKGLNNNPYELKEILVIGPGTSYATTWYLEILDKPSNLKEIYEYVNQHYQKFFGEPIELIYIDPKDKCPWLESFGITRYVKAKN